MNFANRITIIRILLIPLFIASIFYYRPETEFLRFLPALIFAIAIFTDAIDGFIARTFRQKTPLGTILDPLADKLLLSAAFICLSMVEHLPLSFRIPPWVTIIVISRDFIIILGFIMVHHIKGSVEVRPTILGKLTTFLQMMTVTGVLVQFPYSLFIWNVAAIFTILSGMDYIIIGSRMLNEKKG